MKTPEDLKKALACDCDGPDCEGCVYAEKVIDEEFGELTRYHCSQIYKDTLEYIQRLETERHQLLTKCERLERELDAAVADLKLVRCCGTCVNNEGGCTTECYIVSGILTGWKWRGVCEENTKEE